MKKIVAIALAVGLAFSISGCGVVVGGVGTAAYCHAYGC